MRKFLADPRQLDLFGDQIAPPLDQTGNAETDRDDLLAVYYRRLRKVRCELHYDRAGDRVLIWGPLSVPPWALKGVQRFRDRIIVDLMRLQYGVTPAVEREALDGGAILHRLPRRPELDPPVRHTLTGRRRQGT